MITIIFGFKPWEPVNTDAMWSTGFEPFVRVERVAFFISVSGNSVLKFYVANAERNFQVVNLFHSYDLPVGSNDDTICVFAKFVDVIYNR